MKKALIIFLLFVLCIPCACSEEINLDALSFQQLAALRDRIQLVMMQRDEWQEVTVPQGVYEVGKDIPEGEWTISAAPGGSSIVIICDALDRTGASDSYSGKYHEMFQIDSKSYIYYSEGVSRLTVNANLKSGLYVVIKISGVVFTPYTGKPDLGFK